MTSIKQHAGRAVVALLVLVALLAVAAGCDTEDGPASEAEAAKAAATAEAAYVTWVVDINSRILGGDRGSLVDAGRATCAEIEYRKHNGGMRDSGAVFHSVVTRYGLAGLYQDEQEQLRVADKIVRIINNSGLCSAGQ